MVQRSRTKEEIHRAGDDDPPINSLVGDQNAESGGIQQASSEHSRPNGNSDGAGEARSEGEAVEKRGRTHTEMAESFSRLASGRASNAIDAMRGLGHLANARNYFFTRTQIDKMLTALQDSIDSLRKGFNVALEEIENPADEAHEGDGTRTKRHRTNFSLKV